mmetsp:Transcript_3110/g.7226  ORF Transcript_3110/g.7226 Transcript_3110/m.7226 type:complete len:312 (+) Transcript_3110:792-1727(+)
METEWYGAESVRRAAEYVLAVSLLSLQTLGGVHRGGLRKAGRPPLRPHLAKQQSRLRRPRYCDFEGAVRPGPHYGEFVDDRDVVSKRAALGVHGFHGHRGRPGHFVFPAAASALLRGGVRSRVRQHARRRRRLQRRRVLRGCVRQVLRPAGGFVGFDLVVGLRVFAAVFEIGGAAVRDATGRGKHADVCVPVSAAIRDGWACRDPRGGVWECAARGEARSRVDHHSRDGTGGDDSGERGRFPAGDSAVPGEAGIHAAAPVRPRAAVSAGPPHLAVDRGQLRVRENGRVDRVHSTRQLPGGARSGEADRVGA